MTIRRGLRNAAVGVVFLGSVHLIGLHSAYAAFFVLGTAVIVPSALKIDSWARGRRERRRLLADAHYEHDAWKAGDDRIATFGRYQPGTPARPSSSGVDSCNG